MTRAAATDDLHDTVDYSQITEQVLAIAQTERFRLLETLAERLAQAILHGFAVSEVELWVRKLKPPVCGVQESTGARITRKATGEAHGDYPADWLIQHRRLLPPGRALDLACGRGRNAIYLAEAGYRVEAWDRDEAALHTLSDHAKTLALSTVTTRLVDLEQQPEISPTSFDVIIVFYYLQRDLMPQIMRALKPGGVLIYETFLIDNHERFNHPRRREFCLAHNELLALCSELRILVYREGALDPQQGPYTAAIVAQRSA
jgi:SAM-dependent methyltransferase